MVFELIPIHSQTSIIFEDSDLEAAVISAAATKFRCSGQVCIATNRILVQSSIAEEFTRKLVERVETFKVGYGLGKKEV